MGHGGSWRLSRLGGPLLDPGLEGQSPFSVEKGGNLSVTPFGGFLSLSQALSGPLRLSPYSLADPIRLPEPPPVGASILGSVYFSTPDPRDPSLLKCKVA